jgi:hypothetical protein
MHCLFIAYSLPVYCLSLRHGEEKMEYTHSPFALHAKDSTLFHSEEPNGLTLPSTRKKIQSKVVQKSSKRAVLDHF